MPRIVAISDTPRKSKGLPPALSICATASFKLFSACNQNNFVASSIARYFAKEKQALLNRR
jgi:hypothetical protein